MGSFNKPPPSDLNKLGLWQFQKFAVFYVQYMYVYNYCHSIDSYNCRYAARVISSVLKFKDFIDRYVATPSIWCLLLIPYKKNLNPDKFQKGKTLLLELTSTLLIYCRSKCISACFLNISPMRTSCKRDLLNYCFNSFPVQIMQDWNGLLRPGALTVLRVRESYSLICISCPFIVVVARECP